MMLGVNAQLWQQRLHANISTSLIKSGWSQTDISDVLGTTQSTVSRWVSKPVASLDSAADEESVDRAAAQISDYLIQHGLPPQSVTLTLSTPSDEKWSTELSLNTITVGEMGERRRIISRLQEFVASLPEIPTILLPAVGVNVAASTSSAAVREDVAAFPGRLLLNRDIPPTRAPARFGVSRHLSQVLLTQKRLGSSARAIINLKPPDLENLQRIADTSALTLCTAPKGVSSVAADLLLDEGDFGWEPSLYITAETIERLLIRLKEFIGLMR